MQYAYDKLSMNKRNQNTQKGLKTVLVAQLCPTLCNPMACSLCPWNSPGKTTGVGSHFLLQWIFLTQGLNLGLLIAGGFLPSELPGSTVVCVNQFPWWLRW